MWLEISSSSDFTPQALLLRAVVTVQCLHLWRLVSLATTAGAAAAMFKEP